MLKLFFSCCFVSLVVGSELLEIENASSSFKGRIAGGQTAWKGQFPYQVSLRSALVKSHFCGGFIITDRWIGSAAHCIQNRRAQNVIAIVGAVSGPTDGDIMKLSQLVSHPEFNNSNLRNDIGLIKTETKIVFSPTVLAIRLGALRAEDNTNAIATGWGFKTYPGKAALDLQYLQVTLVGLDECRKQMTQTNAAKVYDSSICALSKNTGGACMGDSGGPLVSEQGLLIGVISWGIPCAKDFPDVYTRVASYHQWMDSVIDF